MNHTNILKTITFTAFIFPLILSAARNDKVGVFTASYPTLAGIKWGNWGSRPYEYYWVSKIVPIQGKRVIDLGVGLPSQYNWYQYVINNLKPSFYAGIDFDGRVLQELEQGNNFEIRHMNMAQLEYPDKSFDIAYCISTFEHLPYEAFIKSIQEAHRVLTDEGLLIITLDEEWDQNQPSNYNNGWNTLELSLLEQGTFTRTHRSFGLPEFLTLIENYFTLVQEDAVVDPQTQIIYSSTDNHIYYNRVNRDPAILNSGLPTNSCVSYAVLKKKIH